MLPISSPQHADLRVVRVLKHRECHIDKGQESKGVICFSPILSSYLMATTPSVIDDSLPYFMPSSQTQPQKPLWGKPMASLSISWTWKRRFGDFRAAKPDCRKWSWQGQQICYLHEHVSLPSTQPAFSFVRKMFDSSSKLYVTPMKHCGAHSNLLALRDYSL